jgi:murein L,D-transpeptidase YcbB/YkuD
MKHFYAFIFLILIISCKKETLKNTDLPPNAVIHTEEGKILSIDTLLFQNDFDPTVIKFYQANQYKTFWMDFNCRESIISLLNNVEEEGLNPSDFDTKKILQIEKSIASLTNQELINYDFLLTNNLKRYIHKIAIGSLNPKELYDDWDLKPTKVNPLQLLVNFQKKDSFDYAVNELRPPHLVYKKLKKALQIINQYPDKKFNTIEIQEKIILNDTNPLIPEIKNRLVYWKDLKQPDTLTSIYDATTKAAVKRFQSRHGLAPDGVIGKGTISALNFNKKRRKEQIIANMERWRWYPRDFEKKHLLINIPDYSLQLLRGKDTVRSHRIIVGKIKRNTPILSSKLSYVVFNPTWTLPPTILKEDIIPAATKDRSYFTSKNMTIYEGSTIVSPEEWNPAKAKSYRYVQKPGAFNSLGLVKIMFPNRFSVYLHDTNSRGYFSRENRSLSSGCVRVQDPFVLTEYLLDDPEKWTQETIKEVIDSEKTVNVTFTKNIYLHLLYWTAWSEANTLQFRSDIYNLDADLYKKLRK